VWNRTPERAAQLTRELGGEVVRTAKPADILVNCTSSGMDGADWTFKQLPLCADDLDRFKCVVDFVYRDSGTGLMNAARSKSIAVVDGFALLVGQGALSFELFTGRPAPVEVMRMAARSR
jgi:shikimate 5-dehydrogenase